MKSVISFIALLHTVLRYAVFAAAGQAWFWGSDSKESNMIDDAKLAAEYYGTKSSGPPLGIKSMDMKSSVDQMRSWLTAEVQLKSNLYSPLDVAAVMNGSDWRVTRYLQDFKRAPQKKDLEERFELLKKNLVWRAEWQMSETSAPGQFPCEFYLTSEHLVTHGRDGRLVFIWDSSRAMKYIGQFQRDYYRFLYSLYDAMDETAGSETWFEVITLQNMGYAAIPTGETLATNRLTLDRYPGTLTGINIVDISPDFLPAINFLGALSPRKFRDKIIFDIGENDKFKLVKKRDLPEFMGGRLPAVKSLAAYLLPHSLKDCISLKDAAVRYGWSQDQLDLFLQYNRHEIRNTPQAVNFPLDRLSLNLD